MGSIGGGSAGSMTDGTDMPAGAMIGDRHRVVRLLGKGGMGAVYEAENTWTKRRVAIKLLLPMFSTDTTSVARFQGEAQAATQLAHPNIIDVLDMGQDPTTGALYIVQEFLRGRDLHAHLDEHQKLTPAAAAEILVPVMAALALAHERNIIHRDLKPENIFLVTQGTEVVPKLIDFGLSKVLGEEGASRKTVTGTVMGTPYYMSPEQARGDRAVDARTDIWAMGAVLFEMVSGRVPFEGASATLIMMEILTKPVPRIESVAADVPADVATIVHRALEPDLAKRYPTLRAMLDDVLACPSFQSPDRRATLSERFARSIEHRPPVDVDAPSGTASTMMAIPSTPNAGPPRSSSGSVPPSGHTSLESWQSRNASVVETPRRKVAYGVIGAVLLVGLGAVGLQLLRTPPAPSTPAAQAPPPAPAPSPAPPPSAPVVAAPVAPAATQDAGAVGAAPPPAVAQTEQQPPSAQRSSRSSHHHRSHGGRQHVDPFAPVAPR